MVQKSHGDEAPVAEACGLRRHAWLKKCLWCFDVHSWCKKYWISLGPSSCADRERRNRRGCDRCAPGRCHIDRHAESCVDPSDVISHRTEEVVLDFFPRCGQSCPSRTCPCQYRRVRDVISHEFCRCKKTRNQTQQHMGWSEKTLLLFLDGRKNKIGDDWDHRWLSIFLVHESSTRWTARDRHGRTCWDAVHDQNDWRLDETLPFPRCKQLWLDENAPIAQTSIGTPTTAKKIRMQRDNVATTFKVGRSIVFRKKDASSHISKTVASDHFGIWAHGLSFRLSEVCPIRYRRAPSNCLKRSTWSLSLPFVKLSLQTSCALCQPLLGHTHVGRESVSRDALFALGMHKQGLCNRWNRSLPWLASKIHTDWDSSCPKHKVITWKRMTKTN